MNRYGDWAPTSYDPKGAYLDNRADWLVVGVIRTRDSEPAEVSNFETAEAMLVEVSTEDEDGNADYENHRFGHWGPGWIEILIVKPGSACEVKAREIESRLEDYPLLDEDDVSNREREATSEAWEHSSIRDRVELLQDAGLCIFQARRDTFPDDPQGAIQERLLGH